MRGIEKDELCSSFSYRQYKSEELSALQLIAVSSHTGEPFEDRFGLTFFCFIRFRRP